MGSTFVAPGNSSISMHLGPLDSQSMSPGNPCKHLFPWTSSIQPTFSGEGTSRMKGQEKLRGDITSAGQTGTRILALALCELAMSGLTRVPCLSDLWHHGSHLQSGTGVSTPITNQRVLFQVWVGWVETSHSAPSLLLKVLRKRIGQILR